MDQELRNRLRNVVTQCRKLLEESISQELEGKYAIFAKKDQVTADPNAPMTHLSDEEQSARKDILDHFNHIKARGFKPKDALDQLIREIAFTHLNRFCAYKMMEAREVYIGGQKFREAVSRGVNSNGVKFYLADHPEDERLFNTGHQDVAYRHFLDWLGGLLSDEIGVLFNSNDPANRLYPRQKILDEVLDLLNSGGIKPDEIDLREEWTGIWSQDETIGWVYQYFTPKELREQARKESQTPQTAYELAFRNQFFTPRYVVEFLADNTLGRMWLEMRNGESKLKESCRFLVQAPSEHFLREREDQSQSGSNPQTLSGSEEHVHTAVRLPKRPKKDPRQLRVLDPACGSGHFLLYCFDLLLTIYEEAYADPDLGSDLAKVYPTLPDLQRNVPRLILAHNLHGIDIDLRASQIAALALWLRCQRAYKEMGLKKDRPKITRTNFVCAEPMPGEVQMLREFVAQLEPKVLGQVVEVVFDKMKLAGEVGSLLRIEEEIRDAVAAAKKQWVRETTQATDRTGQPLLFTQATMDQLTRKPQQESLFDLSDLTDDKFFEHAEAQVIEALRRYAERAHGEHRLQRQLFTEDAVRGFSFVDLCHKRYDVVLMNPPFGAETAVAAPVIEKSWPAGRHDLATAFVEMSKSRLCSQGAVGIIMTRTPLFLSRFTAWRETSLFSSDAPLSLVVDLGQGILDTALVETVLMVLSTSLDTPLALDLRRRDNKDQMLQALRPCDMLMFDLLRLQDVPNAPIAYWVPPTIIRRFSDAVLLGDVAEVKQGMQTKNNDRFVRLWWEVPVSRLYPTGTWRVYAKGGEFTKHYLPFRLVVDWSESALSEYRTRKGQMVVLLTGKREEYVHRNALTYSKRSQIGFSVRIMPRETIFSSNGPGVFPSSPDCILYDLSLLNSTFSRACLEFLTSFGFYSEGYVESLVYPDSKEEQRLKIAESESRCVRASKLLRTTEETSREFDGIIVGSAESLQDLYKTHVDRTTGLLASIRSAEEEIDAGLTTIIGLSDDERRFCEDAVDRSSAQQRDQSELQAEPFEDGTEVADSPVTLRSITCDVLSFAVGAAMGRWNICHRAAPFDGLSHEEDLFAPYPVCSPAMLQGPDGLPETRSPGPYPLRINWDGVLVDDPEHADDIIRRVRDVLEAIWKARAEAVEAESSQVLGLAGLREYMRKQGKGSFWDDHLSRYSQSRRNAPIYWLLQSSKKNYALWLYYHRLDKDLLFKALVKYVEPKIRLESSRVDALRTQKSSVGDAGKEVKRLVKELERQEEFLSELQEFEAKLRRVASLHLEPDLNDGVILNIAPLHELVPWKEAKNYWDELLAGKYEWSSIGKQLRQKGLVK
ncbi:MAG: BREX-1 system adenine-specific DNA-methyltransferase PglX [Acidobacteria bacterium]|nr:BREX-1 system adenine-specific DNA-methyltransferase PglX [Acidobacteriota bacterium]